jgi:quinol monooxygenase YgiN
MKKLLIQYKVKADKVSENEALVQSVYNQLKEINIDGFHYATFKLADDASFVHIAMSDTEEAHSQFLNLPAFKKFQENLKERCDELPVTNQFTIIGSHNFLK